MHARQQWSAAILLAVFAAGGVLSPLVHRFSHVHNIEHRHGEAAADFAAESVRLPGAEFYVEERTTPHELACDLCARLTLTAFKPGDAFSHLHAFLSSVRPADELLSGRAHVYSRIRAPPVTS